MGKFIDMTGWIMAEHGIPDSRLTVINRANTNDKKHVYWNCKCQCGKELIVRGDQLKRGVAKSCGCLQKEIATKNMSQVGKLNKGKYWTEVNYVGQKINQLTLLEPIHDENRNRWKWKCQCLCGNYVIISADKINSGHTKSCGCLHSGTELQLQQLFNKLGVNYSKEYTFDDLLSDNACNLRFDFAIFNKDNVLKGLIECQGEQHYSPVEYFGGEKYFQGLIKNDERKKQYCVKYNIPLLIVRNKYLNLSQIIQFVQELQ